MPHRWRLLIAGVFAILALASGAVFALFHVPERLEWPLGLVLLWATVLAGWNLYRWLMTRQPPRRLAPTAKKRRPTPLWRQLPWLCLQVAVLGFCAWLWANDPSPDKPSFGLVLFLGAALAIALTALPFIIKDVIVGQWRVWTSYWPNRQLRRPATSAASALRPHQQETAVTNSTPSRRSQERSPGQIDPDLAAEDAPGDRVPGEDLNQRQEKLIDEAVEETFPASDPIAPKRITK